MTTKFNPARRDPVAEVERCLEQLGVERVDPYIVHWPKVGPIWAWPGMERAQELGYARSIGFSNFEVAELQQVRRASRRSSTRCSSVRTSTGRTPWHVSCGRDHSRGLQPARTRSPPRQRNSYTDRAAPRAHAGPGVAPLVHRARRSADREVDAPRPDRGERADLRLHAVQRGHGGPGRARPHRRHPACSRTQVVVSPARASLHAAVVAAEEAKHG
jgi:Aldo/keto reductase family